MSKRKNPPARAASGAMATYRAAAHLVKAVGVEAFFGLASMEILARSGAPHWMVALYGFVLFWCVVFWRRIIGARSRGRPKSTAIRVRTPTAGELEQQSPLGLPPPKDVQG